MIRADFHIHTTASDGRMTPADIVMHAVKAGLTHIALTDHDTVDGLLAIEQEMESKQLVIFSGIEFSTDVSDFEIHILGYGIDIYHDGLLKQLTLLKDDRINRIHRMTAKLSDLGYPITVEDIMHIVQDTASVGRPHVAQVLVNKGYFTSINEVFDNLLNHDKPGYVPHYKLSPQEVIHLLREAGGISVLAHPGLVGNDQLVISMIDYGVDGLEVFHPRHDAVAIERYCQLAKKHNLVMTGGSDFHAIPGRYPEKLGSFVMPNSSAKTLIRFFGS